ncbi:unnamed protein product [Prunus armeniaca]|uniref:Uncharacterized protein n=1 Tax=Prunus armeniaca TaxID=36596 RepID=A0A6J5XMT4_PRUAR|nr:unnamed protein product [Prunus armeniaca]
MEDSVILEEGLAGFQNSMQAATPVPESECKKCFLASPSTFVTIIGRSECTNPQPPSLSLGRRLSDGTPKPNSSKNQSQSGSQKNQGPKAVTSN